MSILTHTNARPAKTGATAGYAALVKRLFVRVLVVLAATSALAAIMALKIAIYLPRFIHH
jgi:hypothetical protein